jgi:hypothetical protein
MRNDEIPDLITQLSRLQVQQTELLARLQRAADNEVASAGDFGQETREPRELAIGDNVAIKNPNPFQANKGTTTKLGRKRITVTSPSGQKILRAPKSLLIQEWSEGMGAPPPY